MAKITLQTHGPITRVALDGICSGQLRWQELQTDDAEVDIIIRWRRVHFLERLADGLAGAVAFFFFYSPAGGAARLAAFSFKAATLPGEVSMVLCIGLRPRFEGFFDGAACRGPISSQTDKRLVEDALDVEGCGVVTTSSSCAASVPRLHSSAHNRQCYQIKDFSTRFRGFLVLQWEI